MAFNLKKYMASYATANALYGNPWAWNSPVFLHIDYAGGKIVAVRPKTCEEVTVQFYLNMSEFYKTHAASWKDPNLSAVYVGLFKEAADFAAANPDADAPNPAYNPSGVMANPLAWQAYMDANAY